MQIDTSIKYDYNKSDGTVSKGTVTFKNIDSSLEDSDIITGIKNYSKVVNGTAKSATKSSITELDID